MKKKALFLLLAPFTLSACLACGCDGRNSSLSIIDGEATAQTTALSVYGTRCDRYSLNVIEDALQSFMEKHTEVTATYESAPYMNYWKALDRRTSSGNLDDLFMIDRDRLIGMTDILCDLSDAVDGKIFNDFALSQLYGENGAVYAVPTAVTTYGLYVNYDLLEKNGQQVPKNLSEFTAVCNYFTQNGITPVICNNDSSLRSLILARGLYGTYCTADTVSEIAKFNKTPSSIAEPLNDGIDFVYEMIANEWIDCASASYTTALSGDLQLFATGAFPFMITGGWVSSTLRQIIKENGNALNYGIHPYHVNDGASVLVAQTEFICMKKDAGNDAKELFSLLTSPSALLKLNDGQSCFLPVKGSPGISYSDSAIVPSATYFTQGRNVVNGADVNLKIPLDSYLTECGKMILDGKGKDEVKARLLSLLEGAAL